MSKEIKEKIIINTVARRLKLMKAFRSKFVGDNWKYGLFWNQARGDEDNGVENWINWKFNELLSEIEELTKKLTKE